MKTKKIVALVLFIGLCLVSQAQSTKTQSKSESADPDNLAKDYFSQIMGVAVSATTNTKLYQFVYDWIGTPYRLGGDSKRGIDCSKFAYELYDKVFNTSIGYNSRNIYTQVDPIGKSELKAGDLVFFKIRSKSITHIGVYLGDDKFAHASSSKGVMISNLNEAYWKRYYYNGGRMPIDNSEEIGRVLTADLLKERKATVN
ncbi:C40 family peptidase [Sphingobacterium spiritivorum]|uniref:NlpC/P60 family protein n=1 Tax=Sphingobacterium spiritivorum ATCC 33861 TaxID=525373 RepID=D7VNF9_SPHSI|nr:NlpC/P60 family protein [Sphingobacterium spiritivorum]EFK57456.1 NlpC/P60 family protein [Sphingobacterium spiritivorum ATCC 33861]QQT36474.1 C40 family peptidase [Sphingobacterium spiritivorum]WQD33226.1 NlpC/P60 family protein [Sphingobacterium spiritivorum]SUJ20332.1 Probable endopeptidase Spr precursor [Sphingobacterium spiritivorum]